MAVMHSEAYEVMREIGAPEEKAIKAATALSRRDRDLGGDIDDLTGDIRIIKKDVATLETEMKDVKKHVATLKSDRMVLKWMVGFSLALQITFVGVGLKLLIH
ncbi:hypothetical protein LG047_13375 [Methylocystis sp. WRRC1]|uniref:hypothetical protein n=1 Tax=Methylocystis sp. WRRC1 TaxID=1732014 RepID=UPI001D14ED97|nr:hypothetical protein [Methylocystis sp. WRRC1]MCC3246299.1 hypothetical protein [Methylocystis sp. WRRC1]